MPDSLAQTLIRTVSRWPLERLHSLAHDLAPVGRLYRRRLVDRNLALAFPDATYSDKRALARAFYQALAEVVVELFHALAMEREELRQRVVFEGADALNHGGVLLLSHYGNLVWAATALSGEVRVPVNVVYKPPHLSFMLDVELAIAKRFGVRPIAVKSVPRELVSSRGEKRVWALAADQRPGKQCHQVALCGRPTAFYSGPERLARALKQPVYYLSCRRSAPGLYRCKIECIAEPPYEDLGAVTRAYAQKLQADIDHAPADWLWSHNRWRGC